jgi:hypothetical protein
MVIKRTGNLQISVLPTSTEEIAKKKRQIFSYYFLSKQICGTQSHRYPRAKH